MSHVYQPVMLMELLRSDGSAPVETIAEALAASDRSQIDYYVQIVKRMPGPVLSRHGVVERDGGDYRLVGFGDLSHPEIGTLIELCERRLDEYVERRGNQIWQHRSRTSGYVSGSLHYEVLKAARGRCELCGVSGEERALDVDHIVPRSRGGTDDLSNLQALCYRCNQVKGNRDDTDFRASSAIYDERDADCVFCTDLDGRIVHENELAVVTRDAYPVTNHHSLVLPKRHVVSHGDLTRPESIAVDQLVQRTRQGILELDPTVSAFNLGVNDGVDAGQTVMHAHLHVIPRRHGDTAKPAGGVRVVFPEKRDYRDPTS